jgi:single-stranded-DNA-specific exonuclease
MQILLRNRGIEDVSNFINPTLKHYLPDPYVLKDMELAVKRIAKALEVGEAIAILGDYDVDGIAATAILLLFLESVGVKAKYSVPNRVEEGYGLSIKNIETHKDGLIVAVDCGSSALEELSYAEEHGIDIIVIDHHKMASIPKASAIVNPHRPDEKDDLKILCASGLVFLLVVGINRHLRESGFYGTKIKESDLTDYLDLVALATVCDVMDLVGLNRAFVAAGLKTIQRRKNLGIDALLSIGKRMAQVSASTIAFFFGPRINAAGRLSLADISVKLLTTKNPIEARQLALKLDELNKKRQKMEAETLTEAEVFVDESLSFICAASDHWHVGVIGIVAGRLREKFNKPSIVIAWSESGIGKASCRSVPGLDIAGIIEKATAEGLVLGGGGHAMAAGFSIDRKRINDFIEFLKIEIKYDAPPQEFFADCALQLSDISIPLVQSISKLEPFGVGNRPPTFMIVGVRIISAKIVGQNHIQTILKDDGGRTMRTISFKCVDTALGDVLMNHQEPVNVFGELSIAEWNGDKQINLQLEDVCISSDGE